MTCVLTERTVQTIVADLESDGYLRRVRDGRRNRYEISPGAVFKHPAEAGVQVAGLLALLTGAPSAPDRPESSADDVDESDGPDDPAGPDDSDDSAPGSPASLAPHDAEPDAAPDPHVTSPGRAAE
ncbi:hypothetical protein [Streptomyces sp. NPDC058623]|uniref:hypothetical protein n=1 Tax=Streptomyces sp. NPDC058623 TaxID=3346563 RepID=UPI0036561756